MGPVRDVDSCHLWRVTGKDQQPAMCCNDEDQNTDIYETYMTQSQLVCSFESQSWVKVKVFFFIGQAAAHTTTGNHTPIGTCILRPGLVRDHHRKNSTYI